MPQHFSSKGEAASNGSDYLRTRKLKNQPDLRDATIKSGASLFVSGVVFQPPIREITTPYGIFTRLGEINNCLKRR